MNSEDSELLREFKSLRKKIEGHANAGLVVVVILAASSIYQNHTSSPRKKDQNEEDSWRSAGAAMDKFDYAKAESILRRLIAKNPNYFYGYSYLGSIALEKNDLAEAEKQFSRAYDLFPTADAGQRLEAVRKRLAAEALR